MRVLLPVPIDSHSHDFKRLRRRMVLPWRDKWIDGRRVWLRRSRYVAREYGYLLRRRMFRILTVRLLPTLFLRMIDDGFILCSIDIADAYLTVDQRVPAVVSHTAYSGARFEYLLGKVDRKSVV